MTIYIALLRGINVSGHNKIKMAELKKALEELGLHEVKTYIQSGNVLFTSEKSAEQLRPLIEAEITRSFGISITVVLRTAEELEQIIANCPYADTPLAEGESIHVTSLAQELSPKYLDLLANSERDQDEYQLQGGEIYFLFRQRILDSKLAKTMQKLGDQVTTRNWNTMNKLAAMAREMRA